MPQSKQEKRGEAMGSKNSPLCHNGKAGDSGRYAACEAGSWGAKVWNRTGSVRAFLHIRNSMCGVILVNRVKV